MDRKLLDYLPPVLREVLEFQAVNAANEPEIILVWDALARVMANQFLEEADAAGVAVWEKELELYPKDTDTLELRKARIKSAWNLELPYTLPWLRNWLTVICGPEGHTESVSGYGIDVRLDHSVLPEADTLALEVWKLLLAVRPANMRILMEALLKSEGSAACGAAAEIGREVEIFPWIPRLESVGRLAAAGVMEYLGAVEIFPAKEEL